MFGMSFDPWIVVGIAAYSVAVTLVTSWLAAGPRLPELTSRVTIRGLIDLASSVTWMALLYAYGVFSVRYLERMSRGITGYLLLGMLGFLLSWARAALYRRMQGQRKRAQAADRQSLKSELLDNLNYLMLALLLHLVIAWLFRVRFLPLSLIPLWIGALLPDIGASDSLLGRLVPWVPRWLEDHVEHPEALHTPAAAVLVGLASAPLGLLFGAQMVYPVPLGFFTHLLVDLLTPRGVMLLWPWRQTRYRVFRGLGQSIGCFASRTSVIGLVLLVVTLLFVLDLRGPEPASTPAPSYKQTLENYYARRGRTQVFAYIDGSWQTSTRPVSGWFEVLNASGGSFVLRDRYSGMIFSGGQTVYDNVYLNRVVLQTGAPITVKPVEIHLEREALYDALGIVYEMQAEPGLQHIYVSGELLLAVSQQAMSSPLQEELSQTSLRRVQLQKGGHYSLEYLTAAELIALAEVQVETADLVIVATYVPAEAGPTVTPLPSVSVTREPVP